jgi:hypothetical protein
MPRAQGAQERPRTPASPVAKPLGARGQTNYRHSPPHSEFRSPQKTWPRICEAKLQFKTSETALLLRLLDSKQLYFEY